MKARLAAIASLVAALALNAAADLDLLDLFMKSETWRQDANAFVMANRTFGFAFTDSSRTAALSSDSLVIAFGAQLAYEARVFWKDGKMSRVEISLYNKGDASRHRHLDRAGFDELVRCAAGQLDGRLGKGTAGPSEKPAPKMFASSRKWDSRSPLALLQWAYSETPGKGGGFLAEYARVIFVPRTGTSAADNAALTGRSILVQPKSRAALRKDIVRTAKGDVFIDGVPMVDQGAKGYCAAATAERVLRHYGLLVDQHQVAQLAETGAASGTSFEGFSEAVRRIGRQFGLAEEVYVKSGGQGDFSKSDVADDIRDYNRVAKRKGLREIDWHDYSVQVGPRTLSIDVSAILGAMDPAILLEARSAQRQRYDAFRRNVAKCVDEGVPLMWSCLVGLFPEVPDVPARGPFGHMRLVIGYNRATDELLYSDSWGGAHAFKRMPMNQAWAMTRGLVALRPRN